MLWHVVGFHVADKCGTSNVSYCHVKACAELGVQLPTSEEPGIGSNTSGSVRTCLILNLTKGHMRQNGTAWCVVPNVSRARGRPSHVWWHWTVLTTTKRCWWQKVGLSWTRQWPTLVQSKWSILVRLRYDRWSVPLNVLTWRAQIKTSGSLWIVVGLLLEVAMHWIGMKISWIPLTEDELFSVAYHPLVVVVYDSTWH